MTLEFRDIKYRYIKEWVNWTGIIPNKDDTVILHSGDNNEHRQEYIVESREIDGTKPDKCIIIVKGIFD